MISKQEEKDTPHMHTSPEDGAQEQQPKLGRDDRQLADLINCIPGGAFQCANDSGLTLHVMSTGFLHMFGYSKEEVDQMFEGKLINMIHPSDRAKVLKSIHEQSRNGADMELEYRVFCNKSQPMWVLNKGCLRQDENKKSWLYGFLVDITQRCLQQEELRLSLERHQVIMDQATDIIFEWDIQKDTLHFSGNWEKKFGYHAVDQQISNRIPLSENIHGDDMPAFLELMKGIASGAPYLETEFRIRNIDRDFIWCRIRATTQFDSESVPIKAVGVIVDIDEEKKQKQALIAQAQFDTLTGICNKETTRVWVEQRMLGKGALGIQALLIIDVDRFKGVNDTYGHLCGDSVLSDVAAALKASIRSSDVAGRIGGDEFLVYLPEITDEWAVRRRVEQILEVLCCIRPQHGAPTITCSIGCAMFPHGVINYLDLYKCADQALYTQKNNGRGGYTVYNPTESVLTGSGSPSAVGTEIVSDEGTVMDEWMAQYAFRSLYEAKDIEEAINRLLEIIGRAFDVCRAYIFESSPDGTHCSNTFEWCGEGISPQIHVLQHIAYVDELGDYLTNFDQKGIFYCHDIEKLHPNLYAVLAPQGIRSMLQCAMLDEGEFVGYVGFDECRENRAWSSRQIASFKLTADVLSTFLIKLRQKQQLQRDQIKINDTSH